MAAKQLPSIVDSDQYLTLHFMCVWGRWGVVYVIAAHQDGSSYDCQP